MTVKQEFVLRYNGVKLTFGVPLEDVFPEDDIHPYLEYLLTLTYESITNSNYTIEDILTLKQGSMSYRLELKNRMENCFMLGLSCLPGALLWILRHFLGLLPLPILPHYTDGETFQWIKLSEHCWRYIIGSKKGMRFEKLNKTIIELPLANLLFMTAFLGFVRNLIVYPIGEPNINKYAALTLAQYFCSSLFIRPYLPGNSKNSDKNYLPLLLYLILKWPQLKNFLTIHQKKQTSINKMFTKAYSFCEKPKVLKEKSTQTVEKIQESYSFRCSSKTKQNGLNDTYSQTKVDDIEQSESIVESWLNKINNSSFCCCTYGSHYQKCVQNNNETSSTKSESENIFFESNYIDPKTIQYSKTNLESIPEVIETDISTNEDFPSPTFYGWELNELNTKILKTPTVSPISFTDSGEYIFDEYNQTIYEDALSALERSEIKIENLQQIPQKETENKNLMEKVSKIGWSYSAPNDQKETPTNLKPEPSWIIPKKNYQLCFGVESNDSPNENKETFEETTKLSTFQSNLVEFPRKRLRTKRSLLKLKNAVSKIDFLHIFSKKREITTSSSAEQLASKIKYKKMNSSKSNLF